MKGWFARLFTGPDGTPNPSFVFAAILFALGVGATGMFVAQQWTAHALQLRDVLEPLKDFGLWILGTLHLGSAAENLSLKWKGGNNGNPQ